MQPDEGIYLPSALQRIRSWTCIACHNASQTAPLFTAGVDLSISYMIFFLVPRSILAISNRAQIAPSPADLCSFHSLDVLQSAPRNKSLLAHSAPRQHATTPFHEVQSHSGMERAPSTWTAESRIGAVSLQLARLFSYH